MRGLPIALALAGCAVPTHSIEQADVACADGPTVKGMDVSSYDPTVDWPTAHAAGIAFAFVRVSDGTQYPDPMFATHWANAKSAGVLRGA
jgi:lysozyme